MSSASRSFLSVRSDASASTLDSELDDVPTQIGPYLIAREIGRGLTGVVYEARGPDGVVCALKLLRAKWTKSRRGVARFRSEADILAKIEHPNVIAITSAGGLEAELPYFTMELAEGSLCDLLGAGTSGERVQRPQPMECARLLALIARAVDFAYQRGILHRDLKPANILRVAGRELVVADFGIALDLNHNGPRRDAIAGCGTPGYFAPELVRGEPATCSSDVYSLGVILYELMVGRLPVPVSLNPAYYGEHVQTAMVIPPRRLVPGIARGLEAVCLKALEKRPADRYQTAAQLAEDLERVQAGDKPRYALLPSLARTSRDFARRSPLLALIFVVTLLMAGSAGLLASAYARTKQEAVDLELSDLAGMARVYAGAMLPSLELDAQRVRAIAADPRTIEVLSQQRSGPGVARYLQQWIHEGESFTSIMLMTSAGVALTEQPEVTPDSSQNYGWRDYSTRGAHLSASGTVGVSLVRAFLSRTDHKLKLAFVATVFDAEQRYLGLVLATRQASQTFGSVIRRSEREGRAVVLLAPRDREGPGRPLPAYDDLSIVVHPGIDADKREYKVNPRYRRPLKALLSCQRVRVEDQLVLSPEHSFVGFSEYRDPVPGFERHTLAMAVPIGCTGYAIMLEQRSERLPLELAFSRAGLYSAGVLHGCMVILSILATVLTIGAYRRR
ncbi:MAG: Serine/threonine protein kinase PrkC, regulator of stationary phase [Myxococcaceae bacterium]|nr:Serine/threonine protein kinase PrkC, regulator of stationary phase [Myxococcaceae bacterium]